LNSLNSPFSKTILGINSGRFATFLALFSVGWGFCTIRRNEQIPSLASRAPQTLDKTSTGYGENKCFIRENSSILTS
jgi:hypothetical protein